MSTPLFDESTIPPPLYIFHFRVYTLTRFFSLRYFSNVNIVETRMVGSELTIFSNIIGAFITQVYGDLLGSPHYPPPQVAAL